MNRSLAAALVLGATVGSAPALAQQPKVYHVKSPDEHLDIALRAGSDLTWSVYYGATPVITPSTIALTLSSGEVLGSNPVVRGTKPMSVNETITPVAYKKKTIADQYNQLTVTLTGGYAIMLRAYDDGELGR